MSNEPWHILQNGNVVGPLTYAELQERVRAGIMIHSDLVWQDGMDSWTKAGTIKGLFRAPPPPPIDQVASIAPANSHLAIAIDQAANSRMIRQLHEDFSDSLVVVAETIRVTVRLNPVNLQIYSFLEVINQITENTPPSDAANFVQAAMQQVDLNNAAEILDECLASTTSVAPAIIEGNASALLDVWPESALLVPHCWLSNTASQTDRIRRQFERAVHMHRQDLVVIQNNYRQLQEHYPRYHGIMNRSGAWDYIFGFAAGLFGGGLGMIGAQVWDDWRGKSDAEFAQLFSNAIEQFCASAMTFTQKTEQQVESVISLFLDEMRAYQKALMAAIEQLATTKDISAIYRGLHATELSNTLDDDSRNLFEIVLTNLRDQKVFLHSESNVRSMLGM